MVWVGIGLTAMGYAAFFIAWMVASVPHSGEAGWTDFAFVTRVGEQTPPLSIGLGVLSTFTDFYIISIPLLAISGLNMSLAKKLGVSALFATGLLYATSPGSVRQH